MKKKDIRNSTQSLQIREEEGMLLNSFYGVNIIVMIFDTNTKHTHKKREEEDS